MKKELQQFWNWIESEQPDLDRAMEAFKKLSGKTMHTLHESYYALIAGSSGKTHGPYCTEVLTNTRLMNAWKHVSLCVAEQTDKVWPS